MSSGIFHSLEVIGGLIKPFMQSCLSVRINCWTRVPRPELAAREMYVGRTRLDADRDFFL